MLAKRYEGEMQIEYGHIRDMHGNTLNCVRVILQAGTVRDSMAKSLYGALFDWIVFRTNHALLNNKDLEDSAKVTPFRSHPPLNP